MALLRNREVSIVGVTGGEDPAQQFTVMNKDGTTEAASLKELSLSEKEHADFVKQHGDNLASRTKKIKDKDYADIVDAQNPEKIKEKQKKQPASDTPVSVPVQVKPSDVAAAQ